jgi:methionyl-tRNA synthetase
MTMIQSWSMTKSPKAKLVTIALPYANGPIHLGHMLEAIQADIWVRFQKMQGNPCYFISGNDAHGTAIMLSAEDQGITPEALIQQIHQAHHRDFKAFLVDFDHFHTTHSAENKALSEQIYQRLQDNGDIVTREISQAFDPEKNIFLADRFIGGTCPRCHADNQYGDNCEACGATYQSSELINPHSKISGATPIEKKSTHYFFQLHRYQNLLKAWLNPERLQSHIVNKLKEWFDDDLKDWDISRDAPYFGFEIPGAPGKYFYVWLDAPVGYMASFKHFCQHRDDIDFDDFWQPDSETELYHFIGKDIVYFHALFWPAMLHGANYRLPTSIFVHGFLTINGQKMSKSRKTFITAEKYIQHLSPEYLRYYFAGKLTQNVEDIDFNFDDFTARVNADLVGKYVNLASRCAGFIKKKFNSQLADQLHDEALFQSLSQAADQIANSYQALNFNKAVRDIMALADRANQYIDHHKPWSLAKEADRAEEVQQICTQGLNLFRLLTIYLKPILPETAQKVEAFLNIEPLQWHDHRTALLDHTINPFKPLMQRITAEQIAEFTDDNNDSA